MGRKFNLIIFGATSFTGRYCIEEIVKLQNRDKTQTFTWAVSARSSSKLDQVLNEVSISTGVDICNAEKILADVSDFESVREMAKQGEVVLNFVGPYELYNGEGVVRACIEEGTHYMDIAAEADFLEAVQLKFNTLAQEKGVYVVASCGFDSVPADVGTMHLEQHFGGDLNSVEIYFQVDFGGKSFKINYGTWHFLVLTFSKYFQRQNLYNKLYSDPLPKPSYKLRKRCWIHSEDAAVGWFTPSLSADERVINRSQWHLYHNDGKNPVQTKVYFGMENRILALFAFIGIALAALIAQFKFGVYILERFPEIFTFGMFGHEGPTSEQMDFASFTFTLIGKGWDHKLDGGPNNHSQPPNRTKILKVKGMNPAYGATNIMFLQCALALLEEKQKLPPTGGVFTPAVAFGKTNLVERLNQNGVTFAFE